MTDGIRRKKAKLMKVVDRFGTIRYYGMCDDGQRRIHRLGKPAEIKLNGYKAWYQEGSYHNLKGPARVWYDRQEEFWIKGKQLTEQEFIQLTTPPIQVKLLTFGRF